MSILDVKGGAAKCGITQTKTCELMEKFMTLKSILLPDHRTCIAIAHIARIAAYSNGVGIFNIREKMIGWIECGDEQLSAEIVYDLNDIINNPNRAKQPDWGVLKDAETVG